MLTRIITAVVAGACVLAILLLLPPVATVLLVSVLSAVAVYEMVGAMQLKSCIPLAFVCVCMGAAVPFFSFGSFAVITLSLCVFCLCLVLILLRYHQSLTVVQVVTMGFLTMLIAGGLSSVAYLRHYPHGLALLFLSLLIPWMSDTGAYFVGVCCGKHKLCPLISPKKTVEGFVGGIVISVVLCTFFAWVYMQTSGAAVILWRVSLLSLVGAPISVMGDLFASLIKRQHNVKDYGKILPGHGGIMDRFDSVVFVAPVVLLWIQWLPLIG